MQSSWRAMPVAPMFVEICARRAHTPIHAPISTNIGAASVVRCEESEPAICSPARGSARVAAGFAGLWPGTRNCLLQPPICNRFPASASDQAATPFTDQPSIGGAAADRECCEQVLPRAGSAGPTTFHHNRSAFVIVPIRPVSFALRRTGLRTYAAALLNSYPKVTPSSELDAISACWLEVSAKHHTDFYTSFGRIRSSLFSMFGPTRANSY